MSKNFKDIQPKHMIKIFSNFLKAKISMSWDPYQRNNDKSYLQAINLAMRFSNYVEMPKVMEILGMDPLSKLFKSLMEKCITQHKLED
jgi:hypothetical protein